MESLLCLDWQKQTQGQTTEHGWSPLDGLLRRSDVIVDLIRVLDHVLASDKTLLTFLSFNHSLIWLILDLSRAV